jgi:RNA polymerase sigma-70 factor (sigma-E family)
MSRQSVESEFTDFVHAWWPNLYRTSYLLVGDHGLAEDLLQTSLTKTYLAWPRLRDPAAAPAYTRQAILTTATSWFRRKSWRKEVPKEHLPQDSHPALSGEGRSGSVDVDERFAIFEALRRLSPRQRAVIVLRYYEEMSVEETATTLGCSAGTVKRHGFDAIARLRELLGDQAVPVHQPAIPITQGEKP